MDSGPIRHVCNIIIDKARLQSSKFLIPKYKEEIKCLGRMSGDVQLGRDALEEMW